MSEGGEATHDLIGNGSKSQKTDEVMKEELLTPECGEGIGKKITIAEDEHKNLQEELDNKAILTGAELKCEQVPADENKVLRLADIQKSSSDIKDADLPATLSNAKIEEDRTKTEDGVNMDEIGETHSTTKMNGNISDSHKREEEILMPECGEAIEQKIAVTQDESINLPKEQLTKETLDEDPDGMMEKEAIPTSCEKKCEELSADQQDVLRARDVQKSSSDITQTDLPATSIIASTEDNSTKDDYDVNMEESGESQATTALGESSTPMDDSQNKSVEKNNESRCNSVKIEIKDGVDQDGKSVMIDVMESKAKSKLYRVEKDGYDSDSSNSVSDDSMIMLSSDSEMEETRVDVEKKEQEASQKKKKNKAKNRDAFEVDIRTKGELTLEDLPPIEELKIDVDDTVSLVNLGTIHSMIGPVVIVQANQGVPAVDQETIIFTEDRQPLGQVFETFGPVPQPLYVVRFNTAEDVTKRGLTLGEKMFYAPNIASYTHYVFVEQLKAMRGSDASWEHNNEPPPKYIDYSDDEEERRARGKGRNTNGNDDDEEGKNESRKRKKPRQRQQQNSAEMGNPHQGRSNNNQVTGNQWPPASPGHGWMNTPRWPPQGPPQGPAFRHMGPPNGPPGLTSWNMPPRPPPHMAAGVGIMPRGPGRSCWEPTPVFEQNQAWGPQPPHPRAWPPNNNNNPTLFNNSNSNNIPMDYRFIQHRENELNYNFAPHMERPHQQQHRMAGPRPAPPCRMPLPTRFGGAPCFPRGPPDWNGGM